MASTASTIVTNTEIPRGEDVRILNRLLDILCQQKWYQKLVIRDGEFRTLESEVKLRGGAVMAGRDSEFAAEQKRIARAAIRKHFNRSRHR